MCCADPPEVLGLVDDSFRHYPGSSVIGRTPRKIVWDRNSPFEHRLTIFTNENIISKVRHAVPKSQRVAWLQESRGVLGHLYREVESVIPDFEVFLTHDSQLRENTITPSSCREEEFT